MSYVVEFRMQVHSGFSAASSSDVWLRRRVTMPFAPYVGLTYKDGDFEVEVTEVVYDAQAGAFHAYTGDDKTLYEEALQRRDFLGVGDARERYARARSIAEKEYVPYGWEIDAKPWLTDDVTGA